MARKRKAPELPKAVSTYNDIEAIREHGEQHKPVPDAKEDGLSFERKGHAVFGRCRVQKKGQRHNKSWTVLPLAHFLKLAHEAGHPTPNAKRCILAEEYLAQVRTEARNFRLQLKYGGGSAPEPEADRAITVRQLVERYETVAYPKLKAKTVRQHEASFRRFILPAFGDRAVASVTRHDVEALHAGMAATPYQANRVLSLLSVVFNKAVEWGLRPDNPARGVKHFHEHGREDWYTPEELAKLVAALDALEDGDDPARKVSARAILLCLYTGARPAEVLSANWDQFDLTDGVWTKPAATVKQKRVHHLALAPEALELLRAIRAEAPEVQGFVFPSPFHPGKHLKDPIRTWDRAVELAGVRRLRLYDLRHSVFTLSLSATVFVAGITGEVCTGVGLPGATFRLATASALS